MLCLATLCRFLINVLTDFPDFGNKKRARGGGERRKREALPAHASDSALDMKYSLPFNHTGSTNCQALLHPQTIHHPSFPVPSPAAAPGLFFSWAPSPMSHWLWRGRNPLNLLLPLHPKKPGGCAGACCSRLGCRGATSLPLIYISAVCAVNSVAHLCLSPLMLIFYSSQC